MLLFAHGFDKYITYFTLVIHLIRIFINNDYQFREYHKETKDIKFSLSLSAFCFCLIPK